MRRVHSIVLVVCAAAFSIVVLHVWTPRRSMVGPAPLAPPKGWQIFHANPQDGEHVCRDVLTDMLIGHWRPRNVSQSERIEVQNFYATVRKNFGIPQNLQRNDSRCGTGFGFTGKMRYLQWFRALCDPAGPTPCCYHGTCVNRTLEQCTCNQCLDLRRSVHAEFSVWQPQNPGCTFLPMSVREACHVLHNTTLLFIGDSLVRHVYTAFIMRVGGDLVTGALQDKTPPDVRKSCTGMLMFTEKVCRLWLKQKTTLCNGTTQVRFAGHIGTEHPSGWQKLLSSHAALNRVLALVNFGIHTQFSVPKVQNDIRWVLERTKQFRQKAHGCGVRSESPDQTRIKGTSFAELNPVEASGFHRVWFDKTSGRRNEVCFRQLVWMTVHTPGLVKEGRNSQGRENVTFFNNAIGKLLSDWSVPLLNTSILTDSVVTQDGTHFGFAVNDVIVHTILRYIESLNADA